MGGGKRSSQATLDGIFLATNEQSIETYTIAHRPFNHEKIKSPILRFFCSQKRGLANL